MANIIDKVAWTLIKNRKILMVRPHGKDYFINPGGKREQKPSGEWETDEEVLHREVKEELDVELVPGTFVCDGDFQALAANKADGTEVRDRCYRAEHLGEPTPKSEIAEILYMSTADGDKTTATGWLILEHYHKMGLID